MQLNIAGASTVTAANKNIVVRWNMGRKEKKEAVKTLY